MKKILLTVVVFACIFVTYLPAQETKPVLAVLDVTTVGTEESKGQIVYDYIVDLINRSGNYIIVERGELDRALEEIQFSSSDLVDDSTAVEIGKMTGAEAVLISSWTKEEEKYYLSMRVIDIQTAQVAKTSIKQADSFDQVEQITREAVDYLFDLPPQERGRQAEEPVNYLTVETGFSLAFPVGILREVLGFGYNPSVTLSYYFDRPWGSVGLGFATGAGITFTKKDAPTSYGLYSIPVALQVSYLTNLKSKLLLFAQARAGGAVSIVRYTAASAVEPMASTQFLVASSIGAGMNVSPTINLYASGSFSWLLFSDNPYLGIAPGVGLAIRL